MNLNNIQLNSAQTAELYGSHLVITDTNVLKSSPASTEQTTGGIAGKNKKKFIWLVNEPSYPLLSDDDFVFLGDILAACKMNMDDISLINHAHYQKNWDDIVTQLHPQVVISSAVPSLQLPVMCDEYKPAAYDNIQFLLTDSLSAIRKDRAIKGKLWLGLKQMLGI
jgi:hypothetical protein